MRIGLLVSSLLHVTIIGIGIVTIAGSQFDRHELDIEPISIDLVPIADTLSLREGARDAPREQAPAPKPTQKPEISAEARHVGDGQIDSAAPLKPEERPREVETPPPPAETRQAQTQQDKTEDRAPTQPQQPQEPVIEPVQTQTPPVENVEENIETAAIIPSLPQSPPQPIQKPKPEIQRPVRQQPPMQREENIDELLEANAKLIDRTPTQGGGMRRSEAPAGAGAARTIGDNQQLMQTIENVIGGCLRDTARIGILEGSQSRDLVVRVHMRLNRDGSIDGIPDLTPNGGEASEREIATTQGYAALARCAPFSGLPPERYDDGWFDVTLNWWPLSR